MSEQTDEQNAGGARGPAAVPPPRPFNLLELLASMRFAIGLLGVIAGACIVATVIPQGGEVAEYLQHNPEANRWLNPLAAAGLTRVFSSWWFIGLLTTLGASLVVCIVRRVKLLIAVGVGAASKALVSGTLLVHIGIVLTMVGGVIKLFWSERGAIQLREGEQTAEYLTEDNQAKPLPFTLKLVKFEIEHYAAPAAGPGAALPPERLVLEWPDAAGSEELPVTIGVERSLTRPAATLDTHQTFRVTVLERVPDFTIDPATRAVRSRSDNMLNPAIRVRVAGRGAPVERWLFARYPDFDMAAASGHDVPPLPFKLGYQVLLPAAEPPRIKAFKSTLQVLHEDQVVKEQTVEVNAPLMYGGYGLYQSGYNEEDLTWTALSVVRDPGVPVVYLGFILLSIGAFLTACWRAEKVPEE